MQIRSMFVTSLAAVLMTSALAEPVYAASHDAHAGHGAAAVEAGAAETEYRAAMDRMHAAMAEQTYTGNADIDFARGMIPHHQAAIDMAKIVLARGGDDEIRKLAEEIIAAQEREIAQLKTWLDRNAE